MKIEFTSVAWFANVETPQMICKEGSKPSGLGQINQIQLANLKLMIWRRVNALEGWVMFQAPFSFFVQISPKERNLKRHNALQN